MKKVEVLLDLYGEKNFGDVGLKVMKLQFYSVHLANKLKIKHIISTIEYRQLSLKDRLVVYEINERANSMTSAEFIDSSQAEDEYELFSTCPPTQKKRSWKCWFSCDSSGRPSPRRRSTSTA